jgi:cell division septation protein DedD
LFCIEPKFVMAFLYYLRNASEAVRRLLIRMMVNFLYITGSLDVKMLECHMGGIALIVGLYKRVQSTESRDNLFMIIFDYVVGTVNADEMRVCAEEVALIFEMLRCIEAPQHFTRIFRLLPAHFIKFILEHVYPKNLVPAAAVASAQSPASPAPNVSYDLSDPSALHFDDDPNNSSDDHDLPILSTTTTPAISSKHMMMMMMMEPPSPMGVSSSSSSASSTSTSSSTSMPPSPPKAGATSTPAMAKFMANIRPESVTLVLQAFEALARHLGQVLQQLVLHIVCIACLIHCIVLLQS